MNLHSLKFALFTALVGSTFTANADVLTTAQADAICHSDAVSAAHFIMKSQRPFHVTAEAGQFAEISTPIKYEFRYHKTTQAIVTVIAYAYPDTGKCSIASIANHVVGND